MNAHRCVLCELLLVYRDYWQRIPVPGVPVQYPRTLRTGAPLLPHSAAAVLLWAQASKAHSPSPTTPEPLDSRLRGSPDNATTAYPLPPESPGEASSEGPTQQRVPPLSEFRPFSVARIPGDAGAKSKGFAAVLDRLSRLDL